MGGDQGIDARTFKAMTLRVVFRAAARHEFESAAAWYDQQRHGLGEEFIREIDAVVLRALSDPERYPVVCADVRKAVARRFPYAVFFRLRAGCLVVLAVFHGRRDPVAWHRRA